MESDEEATYTHFAHREAFFALFKRFLSCRLDEVEVESEQSDEEDRLVESIGAILDHYLPLPTLLDPHLHAIIPPLFQLLRDHLAKTIAADKHHYRSSRYAEPSLNEARLGRVGKVINWVIKVRGRKAVVTHLPSEVHNLPLLLNLFSYSSTGTLYHPVISSATSWELRSVLLLWLSLLMTIPFNLSAFDESATSSSSDGMSQTAKRVQELSHPLLYKPSKEGEYAALTLARLYARPDCAVGLQSFLGWVRSELDKQNNQDDGLEETFLVNILSFLAIIPGLLPSDALRVHLDELRCFHQDVLKERFDMDSGVSATSSLLRKMAVKAEGRWWMVKIGTNRPNEKRTAKVPVSVCSGSSEVLHSLDHRMWSRRDIDDFADFEPPEGFEEEIENLLQNLSDKDTVVRYSAAKYVARLASVLPQHLSTQIIEALIELFTGTEYEPVVETNRGRILDPGGGSRGDARWHGVCLALAETARRGLLDEAHIAETLPWVIKALTFDIKRGAHSVGSNVRDAAAYLTWSLARASDPRSMSPFAREIAAKLVAVACFDREVGIRRAASAAYQEHVGRMGLFPHGIDVLRRTDFYSVSVRRSAFLTAAIDVAQHDVYRYALIDCLHHTTLRHWDPTIRLLAATSLKEMCNIKPEEGTAYTSIKLEIENLRSLDSNNVHGALAALTELASLYRSDDQKLAQILDSLQSVRGSAWITFGSDLLLEIGANCIVAAACAALSQAPSIKAVCLKIVHLGIQNKKESVQVAAAQAFGAVSHFTDCTTEIKR